MMMHDSLQKKLPPVLKERCKKHDGHISWILQKIVVAPGALVPAYTQERRKDTAFYARGLPGLTEFTIHMWLYGVPDDDNRVHDYIISIATSGRIRDR